MLEKEREELEMRLERMNQSNTDNSVVESKKEDVNKSIEFKKFSNNWQTQEKRDFLDMIDKDDTIRTPIKKIEQDPQDFMNMDMFQFEEPKENTFNNFEIAKEKKMENNFNFGDGTASSNIQGLYPAF